MAPPSASCHRRNDVIFTSVVRCWLRSSRRLRVAARETRPPGDKSEAQDRQALAGSPAASRAWRPRAPCRASQAIGDLLAIGTVVIKNSTSVTSPSGFSSNGAIGVAKDFVSSQFKGGLHFRRLPTTEALGRGPSGLDLKAERPICSLPLGTYPSAARTTSILQQCG